MEYIIENIENTDRETEKENYLLGFGEYLRANHDKHHGDLQACSEAYFGKSPLGREIVDDIFAELMLIILDDS